MYQRKTVDVWEVQGNYGYGHGWEDVYSADSFKDARERLREYRENEPEYRHRLRSRRVKIDKEAA